MSGIAEASPWPVTSRLAVPEGTSSPAEAAQCQWVTPEAQRAGFCRSSGCGRGSFRLQKLTSSVWLSNPWVKNLWTLRTSSFAVRKHLRSERALEAGSPAAKPRARWRVPSGALVDGRHLGPGNSPLLTTGRMEWLSALRWYRSPSPAECDKRCQRANRTAWQAVENAAARQHRPVRCSALPQGRVVLGWPEVGNVPSSTYPPGVGSPQGDPTPHCRSEHVSGQRAVGTA